MPNRSRPPSWRVPPPPAVVAWAFVMSFFTMMCGLVLEGFKGVVYDELEKSEPQPAPRGPREGEMPRGGPPAG
jgi:hypothetical protein